MWLNENINAKYTRESARQRGSLVGHLAKLAVVVRKRSEMDIGDQRKAHDDETLASSLEVRSS